MISGGLIAKAGLAGLAATGLGIASAGLVEASQGGTIGGGAARSALSGVAGIKTLGIGELTGAAPAQRIVAGTQNNLNAITNQVARFAGAGAITPKVRAFLAQTQAEQNKNIEADRQRNTAATSAQLGRITEGQGVIPEIIAGLGALANALNPFSDGAEQHT